MAKRGHNSNKGRTLLGRQHTLESLMARVRIDPQSSCWEWMGSRNKDGYGRVGWHGQVKRVHRIVYELVRGPIDAETLDHVCRNRAA